MQVSLSDIVPRIYSMFNTVGRMERIKDFNLGETMARYLYSELAQLVDARLRCLQTPEKYQDWAGGDGREG